jgi:hypothetical protein
MNNFKLLKEELTIGSLALLGFLVVRYGLALIWPDTPLFDLASEMETILFGAIKLIMVGMITYFVMRIAMPQAFKYFRDAVYMNFHAHGLEFKKNFSIGLAAVIFFALVMFTSCSARAGTSTGSVTELRLDLVQHLETQLDVREATGKNDGAAVKMYLNHVGLDEGYAWCVAFVSYNLDYFSIPNPNSAWSPNYAKRKDVVWSQKMKISGHIDPGDVFTIYSTNRKRVVHGGFVIGKTKTGSYIITIEGNTNVEGAREGIGVFKRKRNLNKIYAISNYITPYHESIINRKSISRTNSSDTINVELSDTANTRLQNRNRLYGNRYCSYPSRYGNYHPGGLSVFEYSLIGRFYWVNPVTSNNYEKQSSAINSFRNEWSTTCSSQLRQLAIGSNISRYYNKHPTNQERVITTHNYGYKKCYSVVGKSTLGFRSFRCVGINHIYHFENTEVCLT